MERKHGRDLFMALMNKATDNSRHALVAMKFDVVPCGTRFARIEARTEGLVSYVFTHLGLSDKTVFEFYSNHVKIIATSWSGQSTEVMPLSQISNVCVSFLKPVSDLLGGILLVMLACGMDCGETVRLCAGAIGIFLLIDYFFSKTISFELHSTGGETVKFIAKRSILEWCPIDEKQALALCDRVNNLIVAANP